MTTTATTTKVYLDQPVDERTDEIALHAVRIDGYWNGFAIPVVTAAEFRRFIAAQRRNDPNGMWGHGDGDIREGDGALIFDDRESDEPQIWTVTGIDADGTALYSIDGWVWSE